MKRINVAIASPGDVKQERNSVPGVFTRWNDSNEHASLHPKMWEFAAVPTLGDHPQHIINKKIIDESDLLVAILWSKLGTPTPSANSGTVEEIREFIKQKGPARVMVYFCTRDLPNDIDPVELTRLKEFKRQMRSQGVYHEYKDVNEFERDLYYHIDKKVEEFLKGKLPIPDQKISRIEEGNNSKPLPVDPRLHHSIDFGNTLEQIARGFAKRMDEFDALDGVGTDKFYDLAAHVYGSVAKCLDRFLLYSAADLSEEDRDGLERISTRLKRLSTSPPGPKDSFPEYWQNGRKISDDLSARSDFIGRW